MDAEFSDRILFHVGALDRARDVAAYNFKCHRSVEYLDLGSNNSLLPNIEASIVKYVETEEDVRKRIQPNRQILYKYHLDLPSDLEKCTCWKKTGISPTFNAFHLRKIELFESTFNRGLERHIVLAIEKAESKIEKLRSYIKTLALLNFDNRLEPMLYLYDSILRILYDENCTDSKLVVTFVTMLDFTKWVYHDMSTEQPCLLEYVLIQAQKSGIVERLWLDPDAEMDPASECFFTRKITNFFVLIKYGIVPSIPRMFWFDEHIGEDMFDLTLDAGLLSFSRVFRVFQVFLVYEYDRSLLWALRYIWRSIKDPFLSRSEIDVTLTPSLPQEATTKFIEYYAHYVIGEGNCSLKPSPRPLMDLCRVEIRRYLSDNYQLPSGVSCLDVPEILKSYLLLER